MNQTRHEQWAYRGRVPQALINNQRHTIDARVSSLAVEARACVERFVGREQPQLVREGRICFTQIGTSLA